MTDSMSKVSLSGLLMGGEDPFLKVCQQPEVVDLEKHNISGPIFYIKNTFIDTIPQHAISLKPFYRERKTRSCPPRSSSLLADNLPESGPSIHEFQWQSCDDQASFADTASQCSTQVGSVRSHVSSDSPCFIDEMLPPVQRTDSEHLDWFSQGETSISMSRANTWSHAMLAPCLGSSPGYAAHWTANQPTAKAAREAREAAVANSPISTPPVPPPAGPAPGTPDLPSIGSAGHIRGHCKPCAFLYTKGCTSGPACTFCHLCPTGERKRRQREKMQERVQRKAKQQSAMAKVSVEVVFEEV